MNTTTDIVLMQQVAKGDEEALRELIDRYRERLYHMAYGLLSDRAAADDAVQETFIRLWTRARRYNPRHTVAGGVVDIDSIPRKHRRRIGDFVPLLVCEIARPQRQTVAAWLYTICVRRCYDELRHRRRHREAVEQMELPVATAGNIDGEQILALLQQAVASLPTKQRVVYQLREIECLDAESTAEALRMTVDQVKANLWNARNAVREKLKQYGI